MLKFEKLDSLDILTTNVPRMATFYHEVLGIPFFTPWDGDEELAAFDLTNVVMCIMRTTNESPPPMHSMRFLTDPPGFDSIALKVSDLDEAVAALDGKVEWINCEPFEMRSANGSYFRNRALRDPDGNMLYIQQSQVVRSVSD